MKKIIPMVAILVLGFYLGVVHRQSEPSKDEGFSPTYDDRIIENAFRNKIDSLQVAGRGVVTRLLADDTIGSRHQKFLVRLSTGHSLLIVHNIDLAPRVHGLKKGDFVAFYGEYEFSPKGGLVHWTHHDPKGRHAGGWIKHQGRIYQ